MELKDIEQLLDRKFDEKLKPIQDEILKINGRLDGIDGRLDGIEAKFERRFDVLETAITGLTLILSKKDSLSHLSE